LQLKLEYEPASISLLDDILSSMMGGGRQYILLSRDGIVLPKCLSASLGFRLCRSWTDISHILVEWHGNSDFQRTDCLMLKFKSGGSVKLYLLATSTRDLEQLLLSFEMWAKDAVKSDQLIDLKESIQYSQRHAGAPSYTDIWEDELSRRFSNTAFVPLSPGTSLQSGRLQVLSQLAFGGFSAVYMVKDRQNKAMILKELVIPKNIGEEATQRIKDHFTREAKILSELNHEQLAKVLDFFVEERRNYLLLEYIRGQNLRQLVSGKTGLQESIVVDWAMQMCSVLEYLHTHHPPVIHRDFTPENLIVSPVGKIVLIDFNAAFELVCTATSTVIGKYAYMAPEQFRGHSKSVSDLYSFGGVMFFLLTGQDPEPISVSSPRQIRNDVSSELNNLVMQLTQFDESLRPASALIVKDLLEKMRSMKVETIEEVSRISINNRI